MNARFPISSFAFSFPSLVIVFHPAHQLMLSWHQQPVTSVWSAGRPHLDMERTGAGAHCRLVRLPLVRSGGLRAARLLPAAETLPETPPEAVHPAVAALLLRVGRPAPAAATAARVKTLSLPRRGGRSQSFDMAIAVWHEFAAVTVWIMGGVNTRVFYKPAVTQHGERGDLEGWTWYVGQGQCVERGLVCRTNCKHTKRCI